MMVWINPGWQFPMTTLHPATRRRNERLLYFELAWLAFAFAMEWWYLQVYIIRLGATPLQIGILTAGRALLLVVGAALAQRWQSRFTNVIRALQAPVLLYRALLYGAIALVPFLSVTFKVELVIGLAILSSVPFGIGQAVFLGMLPLAVGKERLARVVANRSVIMNVSILLAMVVAGQLLEALPRPLNYQVGFGLAFLVSFCGWWNLRAIQCPDFEARHEQVKPVNVWANPQFRRFAIFILAVNTSVFMGAPLGQLHLVRGLNASDSWISLLSVIEMSAGALVTAALPMLLKRFPQRVLITTMIGLTVLQVALLAVAPSLPFYIPGILAFGAGWFAVNVLLYNKLVDIVPPDGLRQYAATYQTLINTAVFVGPLLSTFLIQNVMAIPAALLVTAGLRAIATILSWLLRVDSAPHGATQPATDPVSASSRS
jgi:low affinity Fe/Cu permease